MRLLLLIVWRRRDELESQTGRHPQTRVASVIYRKETPQHPRAGVGRTRGQFNLTPQSELSFSSLPFVAGPSREESTTATAENEPSGVKARNTCIMAASFRP